MKHPRHTWTEPENELLRTRYPNEATRVVAAALGLSVGRTHQQAYRLGLRKTAAYLASPAAGRTDGKRGEHHRFAPGLTPWNKGMTGLQIGGVATQFKPGHKPHTTMPVGTYRIDADGYLQRKIGEASGSHSKRWRSVHELVWIAANGPLPPKHIVVFRPGRRSAVLAQITLDAVECVTRAELVQRNHPRSRSPELAKLVQLKGAITRQVNRIARESAEQQEYSQ